MGLFDAFPSFKSSWISFLKRYGMRAIRELDISRPRWQDEPQTLFQIMLTRAKTTQPDAHRIHYQQLMDNNLANQEEIIAALKSSFKGTLIIPFAKRWMKVAVNLIPLPEHLKYIIMQYFQLIRNEIGIIREYLIENNKINSEDDIWYLRFKEIQEAIMHPSKDYSQLIQERKTLYNHFKKLTPP